MRGFLGKRYAEYVRRYLACVKIQCLSRKVKAKKRVNTRRKYLALHRAALRIQTYFKGLVLMRKAKEECDRRRELKVARQILREQRAYAERIKREAEAKLRSDAENRKKRANRSAATAIAERADAKKKNKESKGRAAPKVSPDKSSKATGKSGKTSPSVKGRPSPIKPGSPYSPKREASPSGYSPTSAEVIPPPIPLVIMRHMQELESVAVALPLCQIVTTPTALRRRLRDSFERMIPPTPSRCVLRKRSWPRLEQHSMLVQAVVKVPQLKVVTSPHSRVSLGSAAAARVAPRRRGLWARKASRGLEVVIEVTIVPVASPLPVSILLMERSGKIQAVTRPGLLIVKGKKVCSGDYSGIGKPLPVQTTPPKIRVPQSDASPNTTSNTVSASTAAGSDSPEPVIRQASIKEEEEFVDEEDEYLTPEQVAEQDRLRAIEEEKRILREKEEAYNESIQKELALQAEAEAKGKAIEERDAIRHAREEKERLAREAEEARLKAIADEEEAERKRIEEEQERLEAEEEERERREAELEDLRNKVIAEERRNESRA